MKKVCSRCKKDLDLSFFRQNKSNKSYRGKCRACENECNSEYRKLNRNKVKTIKKEWREKNKDKVNETTRSWREKNKDNEEVINKMKKTRNDYLKNKRKTDKKFKLTELMRSLLRRSLVKKQNSTQKMLGYTWEQLKQRLECQFTNGMSWDNYGEWHIDHKKPVSMFEVGAPAHTINALCNLQPLWATTREINGVVYEGNLNKQNKFK